MAMFIFASEEPSSPTIIKKILFEDLNNGKEYSKPSPKRRYKIQTVAS